MADVGILQNSDGEQSSKRWFGAICLLVAVALAGVGQFTEGGADVELVKAFLWTATVVLVGGTTAEQIKAFKK